MSTESTSAPGTPPAAGSAEAHADLFADLVIQHTNMALVFCGALPHPETGEPVRDLEMARMLIDRLDMLQAKTRGNLGPDETALLRQSLATVRMAFVQAAQEPGPAPAAAGAAPVAAPTAPPPGPPASEPGSSPAEESRKKFAKKY